jgi:SAM-dependent methyltransferase
VRPRAPARAFAGALFMFNGLMQIPGRAARRRALREIHRACRPEATLLLTTHDRDDEPRERRLWAAEADRWAAGRQDPRLVEFGDRYFQDSHGGRTFMHLPTRAEVREDFAATGWTPTFDAMRRTLAVEAETVREFADECRFWVARRDGSADPEEEPR